MKFAYFLALLVSFHALHVSGQCNTSFNLALGRPATASSTESAAYPAGNAFDGDMTTRWSSAFSDPQYIYVDLGSTYTLCSVVLYWEAAYATAFTIDISTDAVTWTTVATISGNTSTTNTIAITGNGRYVRMSGISRATGYGYSLYEFQVYGTETTPVCGTTNVALNQPATVSSIQGTGLEANLAFDGDMTTRWSSAFSDPQYIYVDLGATYSLCEVALYWEAAYGSNFEIDVSSDAVTWTPISTITGNTSMTNTLYVSGTGRYVRMYGTARATGYGYSLYEFQVYGVITLPVELLYFAGTLEDNHTVSLAWATATETNNDHFDIERSGDAINYTTLSTVKGDGNSASIKNYQCTDFSPLSGANYYRLKQVDANGQYVYSTVVVVHTPQKEGVGLSIYPNPVLDFVQVAANSSGELIRQINLYDVTGVKLSSYNNSSGIATTQIDCSRLTPGVYLLEVKTNMEVKVYKLVK